jgi:hypothetical protein
VILHVELVSPELPEELEDVSSVKTAAAATEDADDQLVAVVAGADHFADEARREDQF